MCGRIAPSAQRGHSAFCGKIVMQDSNARRSEPGLGAMIGLQNFVAKLVNKPLQLVVPQKALLACVTDGLMNPVQTEVSDLLDRAGNRHARYVAFEPSIAYRDVFSMDSEPCRDIANRACPTGNAHMDFGWIEICKAIEFK